jgi:hypothetical protein
MEEKNGNIHSFIEMEPKLTNRFNLGFMGMDVPEYLFRGYKLYNDADKLIFETSFYETVSFTSNPVDFFKIYGVNVLFLEPTGQVASSWVFDVEGISFETEANYKDAELLTFKFKFEVNKKSFRVINKK